MFEHDGFILQPRVTSFRGWCGFVMVRRAEPLTRTSLNILPNRSKGHQKKGIARGTALFAWRLNEVGIRLFVIIPREVDAKQNTASPGWSWHLAESRALVALGYFDALSGDADATTVNCDIHPS